MSYRRLDPEHEHEAYNLQPIPVSPFPPPRAEATVPLSSDRSSTGQTMSTNTRTRLRGYSAVFSYAGDWAICIILAILFFMLDKVPGFKREFSLQDTSLRHTFAVHERVPNWALYVIFVVAPVVLLPIVSFSTFRSLHRPFWWDVHSAWLGWLLSASITGAITQFCKITVGRPRPDVIDRCQPNPDAVDPPFGLSTVAICTQTDLAMLRDGFRSFPSGHASLSFAGLGFLSFFLMGKMHLFDEKGHTGKAWIALLPLSGAALVAISRTMDYRHHWQDVLTGSILGLVTAYFAYRQYYPPLTDYQSHIPYRPRHLRGGHQPETVLPSHNGHVAEPYSDGSHPEEGTRMQVLPVGSSQ